MIKPTGIVIAAVAPPREIDGLMIIDHLSVRNVAHAELRDSLRLPRGDSHESTFVAVRKHYDGTGGGEAGHYLMTWVEFRASGSRWRTAGVKIRQVEAARIVRDMMKGKASKPGRSEAARVGGKTVATDESELRAAPVEAKGYVIYVRHRGRSGEWVRTNGVEVLDVEKVTVANVLKQLAALKGVKE